MKMLDLYVRKTMTSAEFQTLVTGIKSMNVIACQ